MPSSTPLYIAVVGASSASDAELAAAETVGRTLGEAGATVITGGRGGVMEAASRGAASAGATTIGLLPGSDRRTRRGRERRIRTRGALPTTRSLEFGRRVRLL